jgi:hypothetical protein
VTHLDRGCRRHRGALLDFVDTGVVGSRTPLALAHLERCGACTGFLESTALTVTALRRLGEDAAKAEPAVDAWPRLRARLEGLRPSRLSLVAPLARMALTAAFVAILVTPTRFTGPGAPGSSLAHWGPTDAAPSTAEIVRSVPARRAIDPANLFGPPPKVTSQFPTSPSRLIYPDGTRPTEKEVATAPSTVRRSEPR